MKLKELEVSVRLSEGFNSYGLTRRYTVEDGEKVDEQRLFTELNDEVKKFIADKKLTEAL